MMTKNDVDLRPERKSSRDMRKLLLPTIAISIVVAIALILVPARGQDNNADGTGDDGVYAIGLWGDLPYSDEQALTGVPNLIADMNSQHLAFTAHDGDLKAGNGTPGSVTPTTCGNALYAQALGYFNSLTAPAIFTTGDNDWVDCDRPKNGGFNSRERL